MNLVLSTPEFAINGIAYDGFPLLVDSDGRIIEIALLYCLYACIERGRMPARKSWATLGRHLYDYFGFLEGHRLTWDHLPGAGEIAPIVTYRDWSIREVRLKTNTVNQRLRSMIRFYSWAHRTKRIARLPLELESIQVRRPGGMLAHLGASTQRVMSADVLLPQPKEPIKVLSRAQVQQLLAACTNPSHRMIVRLGLATGLRAEELLTFPLKYVCDPDRPAYRAIGISVILDPREMRVKGSRPRTIHVPTVLMAELWRYKTIDRPSLAQRAELEAETLFVTRDGLTYDDRGLVTVFHRLTQRVGFHVSAHMLRHTYATYTLHALRAARVSFDPLLYVRDRLGHSSVLTTERYLHYLAEVEDDLMTRYQEEIDAVLQEAL